MHNDVLDDHSSNNGAEALNLSHYQLLLSLFTIHCSFAIHFLEYHVDGPTATYVIMPEECTMMDIANDSANDSATHRAFALANMDT